jgi:hypothetical protein
VDEPTIDLKDPLRQVLKEAGADAATQAMAQLIQDVNAGYKALMDECQQNTKRIIDQSILIRKTGEFLDTPDLRAFHECAYILQFVRKDKDFRRKLVELCREYEQRVYGPQQQQPPAPPAAGAAHAS